MGKTTQVWGYKHWTLEDVPRCFNVGKGIRSRPVTPTNRNHKWHAIVKRLGLRVEICVGFKCDNHDHAPGEKCQANENACAWEIENIKLMGTRSTNHDHDDPIDIGCNFTDGGEGSSRQWTKEQRENNSIKQRAARQRDDVKQRHAIANNLPGVSKRRSASAKRKWEDPQYRENHSSGMQKAMEKPEVIERYRQNAAKTKNRSVIKINRDTNETIATFPSMQEARRQTGISNIDGCARGERKSAGGFVWRYITKD